MECCIIKLSVGISTIAFGLIFGWVLDPYKASYNIADAEFAITQLAMSTMRVEVGKLTLDKTFEEREQMNANIVSAINQTVANWGLNCLLRLSATICSSIASIALAGGVISPANKARALSAVILFCSAR